MALVTDDPNDPATQLRNKIKTQVAGTQSEVYGDPQTAVAPVAPAAPAATSFLPGDTQAAPAAPQALPKQGITDPTVKAPDPGTPAPAAPTQPVAPTTPTAPQTGWGPETGGFNPTVPFTGNNNREFVQGLIQQYGLVGHQADKNPASLATIVEGLRQNGVNASMDTRSDGLHKGIMIDGKFVKLLDGSDNWIYDEGGATGGGNGPQGGGVASAPVNPAMPPATSQFTDQIRKMLMDRMGRDTASVNESDSNIAQPFNAANLEAQRGQQNERTALAERLAASGDTSGSLERGIQQSAERNAVGLGTFKGKLIQQAYDAKRVDLDNAMQQALASGDRETAFALQTALAQLDAQLRREGYGVNLAEFGQQQNAAAVGAV